ncbi:MAG: sugar phosphate isomerase/epimerase [Gordonia sp.]|uniref:sugar phosphate isomerase/epimerase family protein n=1 Tax=Gordonia sp. (in: high G+C Gram-positive bacteria) TaxID=84139 RepID=UPI001D513D16|nr:sugar phosphate isomerase/epimerase [Gordonia sp. (in: high G+C Gram-positive bacteria)]MCB1295610.1 sugar phosphate isomerase/epimerase [Gordonia sp. (in: high G+C Gram-positive bacteria)]HMS75845.1 sugar phosphate isomerase/epimerase [Gordonia sp. (in: high G+C Gram-positive bacteria)]
MGPGMGQRIVRPEIPVGLSTASVYPQNTEAAFQYAAELGFDGIELMVWGDPISQDIAHVEYLSSRYQVPILSIHAPCLIISQRVWGKDPVPKLARAVHAAEDLGAPTVVVHPPFRWQRYYVDAFDDIVGELEDDSGVAIAVENMFPMRADRLFGAGERSARRLSRRGGGPGAAASAFGKSIDPTDDGYRNYTLDLSHTAMAGADAQAMFGRMGTALTHLHLADGSGAAHDEHLLPGDGTQPCATICRRLAESDFDGAVVLEITTSSARTKPERGAMLARALDFARTHLARHGAST